MRVPVWQLGPVTIWSPALEAATTAVTGGDELTIDEILDCLETNRQRATYGAVAEALGYGGPRNVKWSLIEWNEQNGLSSEYRGPKTSWVVYKSTGEPAGYDEPDTVKHPDLYQSSRVLETGRAIYRLCR